MTNKFEKAFTTILCHIDSTNYWKYALQLNVYKFLLMKNYSKRIGDMYICQFHPEQKVFKRYKVPDLLEEVLDMFNERVYLLHGDKYMDQMNDYIQNIKESEDKYKAIRKFDQNAVVSEEQKEKIQKIKESYGFPNVFFEIYINGNMAGRIEFELFNNCPKTAENFRCLCTGEKGTGKTGDKLHYKGTIIHRAIHNFMIQGGDIIYGDGTGGESIYGIPFPDETFENKFDKPFRLAMASCGDNTNASQFFITIKPAPWLDNRCVCFGQVVKGAEIVQKICEYAVYGTTGELKKNTKIVIVDCGEVN